MRHEVRNFLLQALPPPVEVRHAEYSMIFSADDDLGRPTPELIQTALRAVAAASDLSLTFLRERMSPPFYAEIWPGEHYRLLAGLIEVLKPRVVVEVGTGEGLAALSMKPFLPSGGKILTFDIRPWHEVPNTCLRLEDFEDGSLNFFREDLTNIYTVRRHASLLARAELLLIDAAKDGVGEALLINHLQEIEFVTQPLFVFDDIRLWNMLRIWREITLPKLDLTSFGHWSGTGLVEWKRGTSEGA